jgi:hypothetical protein
MSVIFSCLLVAIAPPTITMTPIGAASMRAPARPAPRCNCDDDQQQPVKRPDDIVERRHHSFEDVRGNRDNSTREPWAKEGSGIAPVKDAMPNLVDAVLSFWKT